MWQLTYHLPAGNKDFLINLLAGQLFMSSRCKPEAAHPGYHCKMWTCINRTVWSLWHVYLYGRNTKKSSWQKPSKQLCFLFFFTAQRKHNELYELGCCAFSASGSFSVLLREDDTCRQCLWICHQWAIEQGAYCLYFLAWKQHTSKWSAIPF